jgi:ATP-dependent Clp protease ATP-binding subunit ClpA
MRQNWLAAEHYLLAVLAEPGVATGIMAELGVTHEGLAGQLDRMNTFNGRRIRYLESKGISTNPRAHDVAGWANGFAAAAGRKEPSQEDWLLATLYEGGGIVWTVLRELGVSAAAVVDEMRRRGVATPDFNPMRTGRGEVTVRSRSARRNGKRWLMSSSRKSRPAQDCAGDSTQGGIDRARSSSSQRTESTSTR